MTLISIISQSAFVGKPLKALCSANSRLLGQLKYKKGNTKQRETKTKETFWNVYTQNFDSSWQIGLKSILTEGQLWVSASVDTRAIKVL